MSDEENLGRPDEEAAILDRRRRDVGGSVIIRMSDFGEFFATRERARQLISEEIDVLPVGEPVILEWDGVQAVTNAFMSEMTAWLYRTGRRVGNRAMNDDVQEAFALACRRAEAREEPRQPGDTPESRNAGYERYAYGDPGIRL